MNLLERLKGLTCIEEANLFVITEAGSVMKYPLEFLQNSPSDSDQMFDVGVTLDRSDTRFEAVWGS